MLPVSQTLPNVQPDEILRTLDGDTRYYLKLLLSGGAAGLGGHGEELSAGLRRLDPTARDIAKINGLLSERRENIRNVDPQLPADHRGACAQGPAAGRVRRFLERGPRRVRRPGGGDPGGAPGVAFDPAGTRSALESTESFAAVATPALSDW